MSWERSFTELGITLILIGISLIIIPIVVKSLPAVNFKKIPWFLLYVYQRNGFFFATSPILILVGIVYLLWAFLRR